MTENAFRITNGKFKILMYFEYENGYKIFEIENMKFRIKKEDFIGFGIIVSLLEHLEELTVESLSDIGFEQDDIEKFRGNISMKNLNLI